MFEPIKELGQNFLIDGGVVEKMANALELGQNEEIIEIGPGHGIITEALTQRVEDSNSRVIAVEVDERLCKKLESMFLEDEDTKIVCSNILDYLPTYIAARRFKIIGSLPYYITSPILHKVIKMKVLPELCVFLIQKEVSEKVNGKAPDSTYLSSFVQTFFEVSYLGEVKAAKFNPVPEVDGGIIKLTKKSASFSPEFIEKYEGFLHKAFSHPRKMLNKAFSKEELEKGGVDPNLRAQNLNSEEWVRFFHALNPQVI